MNQKKKSFNSFLMFETKNLSFLRYIILLINLQMSDIILTDSALIHR